MAVNIKAVKAELLKVGGGATVSADTINNDDIMDMMLKEYFNPASNTPKAYAVTAIAAGASMCKGDAELSEIQVKSVLDKFQP